LINHVYKGVENKMVLFSYPNQDANAEPSLRDTGAEPVHM